MFRATVCPSSGEITVLMQHLVLGIHSTLHTKQSSTQNNKYQVSHKHSCFSWWWEHSRPKHVEKRNKHTKKNVVFIALYEEFVTPELRVSHTYRKACINIWDIIHATIANYEVPAISVHKFHVYDCLDLATVRLTSPRRLREDLLSFCGKTAGHCIILKKRNTMFIFHFRVSTSPGKKKTGWWITYRFRLKYLSIYLNSWSTRGLSVKSLRRLNPTKYLNVMNISCNWNIQIFI